MRVPKVGASNIVLPLLCALYLILYIDRVNISTAAPLIQIDLRLSNTGLGFAFSAFAYSYAFCQLFGGLLGDKFGARRTLCVSILIVCLATAATGAVGGLFSLFLVRVALGFGEGAALPTATHAMSDWVPAKNWGFAQGITHSFARLGNFAAPPIVAALIAWSSWRASFYILAAASLVWMVVWFWYFRDRSNDSFPRDRHSVPWLKLARRTAPATAVNFCYGWTLWLFLTWIPSFFVQNYHLDLASSALYASGVFFGGVIGDTFGGLASDRILRRTGNLIFARRSVIVVGFVGAGVFLIPVVLFRDLTVSAVCLSLAFFFAELIVAPIWAVTMDVSPHYAGSASGLMNFGSAFAGIVSPFFFGYMIDLTGSWTVAFVASILFLLLGAALAFTLHPDRPFAENDVKTAHFRGVPKEAL